MRLGDVQVGGKARVVGFEQGSKVYRQRLLAMGLTPGTAFVVRRRAPMGDPVEIEVRGFSLSLRKGEAAALRVEKE